MRRTVGLLSIAVFVSVAVLSGGAVSQSFGLSVADSVETPERTVDHDVLGEHTFSAVGVTTPGDPLSVTVTAPSGETHFLDLYKGRDRVDTIRIDDGSETVSIPTDELNPGTYYLRIESDGSIEALHPVVVEGYDISVEQTENTSSDELAVTATVTPTASSGMPDSVEAVVWNDDIEKRETLTSKSGGSYVGTVPLSAFGDESFDVHVAARGGETVNGQDEILAIGEGDSNPANGGSADDGTDGGTNDGSTGNGATDDGSVGDGDIGSSPAENSTDGEPADNSTDDSTVENGTTDRTDETTANQTDDQVDDQPATDSSVIEPTDPNGTPADDSAVEDDSQFDDDVPLSPAVTLIAVITSGLVFRRSSRR
jgi:hypothetical protein